jgi:hypothetical protein
MADRTELQAVFEQLRGVLQPYAEQLVVGADTPGQYSLNTPYVATLKKELFFAGAQIGKNYVTFHLMPVYGSPALREALSAELKQRMHGRACFNFTRVDPEILAELSALTARGLEGFRRAYPW